MLPLGDKVRCPGGVPQRYPLDEHVVGVRDLQGGGQVAVDKQKFSDQRELMHPPLRGEGGGVVARGQPHPAEHERAAVVVADELRRVELRAVIQRREIPLNFEPQAFKFADDVPALVRIRKLRAKHEHVARLARGLIPHAQQVRALPHVGRGDVVVQARELDLAGELPRVQVVGGVEHSGAGAVFALGAKHHPPRAVRRLGDVRVAVVRGVAVRGAIDRGIGAAAAVGSAHRALDAVHVHDVLAGQPLSVAFDVAGVKQANLAVVHHARAGVAAVFVVRHARVERVREVPPHA